MNDLLSIAAFNARYAQAIDSDALETWPAFFTEDCHYRITHVENEQEGLAAGIVYADSRAMLGDRILSLRRANVYERQRYRHLLGMPALLDETPQGRHCETPFLVFRIMRTGETSVFASGRYIDRLVIDADGELRIAQRDVVCDSHAIDTLLAIPL